MSVTRYYHAALHWIESQVTTPQKQLKKTRESLSQAYQTSRKQGFLSNNERITYLLSRFPATYHVCTDVLNHLPKKNIRSILDLGAGPGTATLAFCYFLETTPQISCIESDPGMATVGQQLQKHLKISADWSVSDITTTDYPSSDLVILSYVLTEMSESQQLKILKKAWNACEKFLVIISPGSSLYFKDFLVWRENLLEWGARILAPCPSQKPCPMENTKDWCHFKSRIQRTSAMRHLKSGTASYEDEPYSYLVLSKSEEYFPEKNRIVMQPQQEGGHILFTLCEGGQLVKHTVTKSNPSYKASKKLNLGDCLGEETI